MCKRIITLFALLLYGVCAMSQNSKIDNLFNELKRFKNDTVKFNILRSISDTMTDDELWKEYTAQLKSISESNLANNSFDTSFHKFYLEYLAEAFNNLAVFYNNKSDYKQALSYLLRGLKIMQELKNKKGVAYILHNIGGSYQKLKDNTAALKYYTESMQIMKECNDKYGLAHVYQSIGIIYYYQGNLVMSLDYDFKSLKLEEELGDKEGIAFSLNNLGSVYQTQGDLPKALDYCLRAINIRKQIRDKMGIAESFRNVASIYNKLNNKDKSLEYLTEALKISEQIGNKRGVAKALESIGMILLEKNNFQDALKNCLQSLEIWEETGEENGMATTLNNIGVIYFKQKRFVQSEEYCKRSLRISRKLGLPENIRDAANQLKLIYKSQNRLSEAFEMEELFVQMRDSITNEETRKEAIQKQMQYEFDKRETAIKAEQDKRNAVFTEQNKLKELQLSRSRYITLSLSTLLLLFLVIGFVALKQNKLRTQQKTMQLEQKLLRSQMNPHFIFNCLQAIENFIDEKQALKYLSSFGALTRSVLENSRMESIPLKKEIDLLEHYLELQKLLHEQQFDYKITVQENLDVENIHIPPMIAQPFIENAIEHGLHDMETGGLIEILFSADNENLLLVIRDNGTGIKSNATKNRGSLATTITKERFAIINKGKKRQANFTISEAYPGEVRKGVKVNFTLPLT